jgi:hypothetical protein
MSDSDSGWWQASDGKWYPPETKPNIPTSSPAATQTLNTGGFCPSCGAKLIARAPFCSSCGAQSGVINTQSSNVLKGSSDGKGFAITGLVLGILSLLFFPILFGPLGVIFGSIAWSKGNRFGMISTLVAIPCMYFGMLFGMIVWSAL